MASPEIKRIFPRGVWTGMDSGGPTYLSTSPFIQEIFCHQCRRHLLPDLVASLPPFGSSDQSEIPRSAAIDIPGAGGGDRNLLHVHNHNMGPGPHSAPASHESIGQELRRIGDDFDRSFGSPSAGGTSPNLITARSRSLSFLQSLPRFSSRTNLRNRRNSTAE